MAAFEGVSTIRINTLGGNTSEIDIRAIRLPHGSMLPRPSEAGGEDDFDPRQHRRPRKPISTKMAYFNLLRTAFGAGVLGLPLGISQAGLVLGPILSLVVGVIIIHSHKMLLQCLNEISRKLKIPHISYRYGFRIALLHGPPPLRAIGEYGPCVIAVFMIMSQIGICSVFVIFTADSLKDIMDWPSINYALLSLFVPYLFLEFLMQNLAIVSYVSMAGNCFALTGFILIFYHIFADPRAEYITFTYRPLPILFSLGSFLFNMSAVGVVLSLDRSLPHPQILVDRYGVINVGGAIAVVVCTTFGALGYWSFGTMEENVLRSLPFDDYSAMTAIGLYLITVALTYPLQCYPGVKIAVEVVKNLDTNQPLSDQGLNILEHIARPLFVLTTFSISYFVPFQGPFVAFVGNLCTTLLSVVFPATMELCLMYPRNYGKYRLYLIKNICLIVLGIFLWLFGVAFCSYLIYIRIVSSKTQNAYDFF